MVDLGRLAAAVAADPLVPLQHGAAQQRVDSPLRGIGSSRIPVEEGMGRRRNWQSGMRGVRTRSEEQPGNGTLVALCHPLVEAQWEWWWCPPRTVHHESQVILMITAVIPRPISGSAIGKPMATTMALATTARLT